PTSMNGMGAESGRVCSFMDVGLSVLESAGYATGHFAGRRRIRTSGKTAHGDLETRDALLSGNRRDRALANRLDEGQHLRPQRLGIPHGEMPHRIAAVRLKSEAFCDLTRQEISDDIFLAGSNVRCARFEWGEPVRIDVSEHAGGRAELQQRYIFPLGDS